MSLKLLEHAIANLAGRLTDGSVESLRVSGGGATIVFEGPHRHGQLELLAAAARKMLDPSIVQVTIVDNTGSHAANRRARVTRDHTRGGS